MKIEKITLKHIIETQPDLSYLGIFSNTPADVCIDRQKRGDLRAGEYRYFNLGCGDAEYIEQDYERMTAYNNQQWFSMGIKAVAGVSYLVHGNNRRLEPLTSGGLWGIESDSGDYIEEMDNEQLDDLRQHLEQFGITCSDEAWSELCEQAKNNIIETWGD